MRNRGVPCVTKFVPILLCVILSSLPSTRLFFPPPVLSSQLQLQLPCALSGFLLLSERLKSQDLVSPAGRMLPTAVLCWDIWPTLKQREKGEARNLSSLQVLSPLQQEVRKWQTKHRFAISLLGELVLTCAQPAEAEAPVLEQQVYDSERTQP